MAFRQRQQCCICSHSLLCSSALIFLFLVSPSSSSPPIMIPPTPQHPLTKIPTTLQTSTMSAMNPTSHPLSYRQSPGGSGDPADDGDTQVNPHIFNYYFLIVAAIACMLCGIILYMGRRRRRKAVLTRSHGQAALARDVAGFGRFGRSANSGRHGRDREDGLDERGVAPPPYVEGMKPPSISAGIEGLRNTGAAVELQTLSRAASGRGRVHDPPGYHENPGLEFDMARPTAAVTAGGIYGSSRRLLSSSGSSVRA